MVFKRTPHQGSESQECTSHLGNVRLHIAGHRICRISGHDLRVALWVVGVGVMVLVEHALPSRVGEARDGNEPRDDDVEAAGRKRGIVDAFVLSAVTHRHNAEAKQQSARSAECSTEHSRNH
eukprot:scaffold132406_cov27-Tisochrysis_lutea.AAC.4